MLDEILGNRGVEIVTVVCSEPKCLRRKRQRRRNRSVFFFSSRRRHTISDRDWSSDVCSSDLGVRGSMSPDFYIASRAHHADVGGAYAGSMGLCREIYQEGVRIPPVKLMQAGVMNRDVLAMLLNNVRTPEEREGDLGAQIAACHTGAERLREVCARYGLERAKRAASELLDYSEELMRAFLLGVPEGEYS